MGLMKHLVRAFLSMRLWSHSRTWLPSRGNALFTLVIVGLAWSHSVGAVPFSRIQNFAPLSTNAIAYQGRLAFSDGTPVTGTRSMIFRLYNTATGGTALWEEQWTGANSIQVVNGLFDVMLGSRVAIPATLAANSNSLFLGISVDTDGEMSPRLQLGSTPFAMQALTLRNGSVDGTKLAATGFGPSNKPLLNFIPTPKTNIPNGAVYNSGTTNWTPLDLSGIVPVGTTAVLIYGFAGDSNGSTAFSEIRFSGFATTDPNEGTYSVVPQGPQSGVYQGIVPVDANRRMYYKINASGPNTFSTGWKMIGYWEPANR